MTQSAQVDLPHSMRFPRRKLYVEYLNFDYLFVAGVFTTALFILLLPGWGPLVFIAAPFLFLVVRPGKLAALAPCMPIILLGLFSLFSALWSDAPGRTVYYGLEYLITILLACQIGSSIAERKLLHGLFTAFFLFGTVNFLFGVQQGELTLTHFYSHAPFQGLMASKNTQADMSALGIMVSLTMVIDSLRHRSRLLALAGLAVIMMNLLIIANAQSAGAVVAIGVGSIVVLVCTATRVLSVRARVMTFVGTLIAAMVVLLTESIWYESLFKNALKIAGKDSSLTGRTYIWSRADVAIRDRPILGRGFGAYWREGNLEAEAIWRHMGIPNRFGFNFHNTYYEIYVHLGLVGLVLFLGVFVPLTIRLLVRTVRLPTSMSVLFTAIFIYEASRLNFESLGLGLFHYTTFLAFAGLAWATRPIEGGIGPTLRDERRRSAAWRSV